MADEDEVELERAFTRKVVDLAMRVAELMLTVGASVNDVTLAALQITKAYGVTPVHVDVTYTSITVSYHRGTTDDPLAVTRVIRARTVDYTRLQRLIELTAQIENGLDIDAAWRLAAAPGSLTGIEVWRDGNAQVAFTNDTHHLR